MVNIDQLRGMYVKSPLWVRQMVAPGLALLPADVVYGKTYRQTREAIGRSRGDVRFVEAWRAQHLQRVLQAASRSEHYQALFADLGLRNPTPDDLWRLPILTREDLRPNPKRFLAAPEQDLDMVTTSGSSGVPLVLYLDKNRSVREWAFVNEAWSRIGFLPKHRRAVLSAEASIALKRVNQKPWGYEPALRELRLSPFHLHPQHMDAFLRQISRLKIDFLQGYPSAMYVLALHAIRIGWEPPKSFRGILPTSETVFPQQRAAFTKAFGGAPTQPFYGLSEKVAFASETALNTYTFDPLYGFTEIVDDAGKPVRPGETGRLVSTGLLFSGMPLLRYDTGDRARLLELPTAQNAYRLQADGLRSRWAQEYVVTKCGALIALISLILFEEPFGQIRELQFFQDTPGELTMRIVPTPGVPKSLYEGIARDLEQRAGGRINIRVELLTELPKNTRGKRKFIEQRLDLQRYTPNLSELDANPHVNQH